MSDDEIVVCDICGEETADADRITDENWEYCTGLEKQFCGECREADMCYNARTADTSG